MCKKIIQLGCLAVLSFLLVACKNHMVQGDPGSSLSHDAQCHAIRHEIATTDSIHNRNWTQHRIQQHRIMLHKELHKQECH